VSKCCAFLLRAILLGLFLKTHFKSATVGTTGWLENRRERRCVNSVAGAHSVVIVVVLILLIINPVTVAATRAAASTCASMGRVGAGT